MKQAVALWLAILASPVVFAEDAETQLEPGDGDVTILEDTGEDERLDAIIGDPNSGLFDNFVQGQWRDPFSMSSTPRIPDNSAYYGTSGSTGGLANMFAPGSNYSSDAFRSALSGTTQSQAQSFAVQPVPEPGTWCAIVAVSVIGVSTAARRFRRRA